MHANQIIEARRGTNTNRTKNGLTYNHGECEGAIHRDCRSYKSGTQRKRGKRRAGTPQAKRVQCLGGRDQSLEPKKKTKQTQLNIEKKKYMNIHKSELKRWLLGEVPECRGKHRSQKHVCTNL